MQKEQDMSAAAIFDVDGTLFSSMHVWEYFARNFLRRCGVPVREDADDVVRYMCLAETAEFFINECGVDGSPEEVMAECNKMLEEEYFYNVQPKENVHQLLEFLKENNIPAYIATATDRYLVEAAIKRCGIDKYFCGILTCTEAGAGKTKPDIFYQAAEKMGSEPRNTWIFEDALHAVTTAKKAGFKVCTIYDESESDHRAELEALSDIYIENFGQLDKTKLL